MKNSDFNVLVVDNDAKTLKEIQLQISKKGYKVKIATNGRDTIKSLKTDSVDIIILDYVLEDADAEEIVFKIRQFNNRVVIIINAENSNKYEVIDSFKKMAIQGFRYKDEEPKTILYLLEAGKRICQQIDKAISSQKTSFGYKIKECREKTGKSQEDIASYLGLTRQAVGAWENDTRHPDIHNLKKLCILYGVTSDYLLEGINSF